MKITFSRRLGAGGFGDVWEGTDELGRSVAVKIVRSPAAHVSNALDHAKALARLKHPNVVSVHSIERVPDPNGGNHLVDAVVMERLRGDTLTAALGNRRLTASEVSEIGRALLDGLDHIHKAGLAHGDLHADNVMLDGTIPKIIDVLYTDSLALLSNASKDVRIRKDVLNIRMMLCDLFFGSELDPTHAAAFNSSLGPRPSLSDVTRAFEHALVQSESANDGPKSKTTTTEQKQPIPDQKLQRRSLVGSARQFSEARLNVISSRQGPAASLTSQKLVCIHVFPASAISNENMLAVNELDTRATFLPPFGSAGFNTKFNGEGLLRIDPDSAGKNGSYLQVFRNGAIESVNSQMLIGRGREDGLPGPAFCMFLGKFLSNIITFCEAVKIPPPVCMVVTLVGLKGAPLLVEANPGFYSRGFDRDLIRLPEIVVEEFAADPDPKRLLRPALDVLWQHAGEESCPYFLSDGTWNLRMLL